MLGVALLVIVLSVMDGFGQIYREKIILTNGHLRIESGGVIYNSGRIEEILADYPEIAAAEPYAQGVVMLQYGNRPAFPFIRGIDPALENRVIPLGRFLLEGRPGELDDDSVFLSRSLAQKVGVTAAGDEVDVFTPLMLEKLREDEVLLPRELRVAGFYETGWYDFDSNTLICSLRRMQELYGLDSGVHGVALRLAEGADERVLAERLNEVLPPPLRAVTWIEMFENFLWILKLEKNLMFFLLLFIVLVAAFAISIAQLLTVARKTREIGLLSALGAEPGGLALCFCFQGLVIGIIGTILGFILGLAALYFRNEIIRGFAVLTDSREVLLKFYQFADLPAHYTVADFAAITVCALALSALAGLVPAIRASRLKPADALRSE